MALKLGFTGSINPNKPIPIPAYEYIFNPLNATIIPPTAPPIQLITNIFLRGKVTPYVAGSVTPNIEDINDGKATDFNFSSFVLKNTAKTVPQV